MPRRVNVPLRSTSRTWRQRAPWYFLHIPKAGGTTIVNLLRQWIHPDHACRIDPRGDVTHVRSSQLAYGHVGAALADLPKFEPRILTQLREPGARLLSFYRHAVRAPNHPHNASAREKSFADFLHEFSDSDWILDTQARMLASRANETIQAPGAAERNLSDDAVIERATETIERASWVGVFERWNESVQALAAAMLRPFPPEQPRMNASAGRPAVELLDGAADLVDELTRLDRVVYEIAREKFERQMASLDPEGHRAWWEDAFARSARRIRREHVLDMGDPHWMDGWWAPEKHPNSRWLRWSGPSNTAHIHVPLLFPHGGDVVVSTPAIVDPAYLDDVVVAVNGEAIDHQCTAGEGRFLLAGRIPASEEHRWTTISIHCPTVPWVDLHPETRDPGRRGIAIDGCWLTP